MSDGIFTQQAELNLGAIPASAEELSQRYQKLFQQFSRLKAQHAVLKKAVIKEQASNVELHGNVKQKEKELRKLQEQLDLLAFHNERLTKRIQAVQDNEQKGSHFSLLGGTSIKKELEKSEKALDAANLDLEQKINENERLHEELTERQKDFTDNINNLLRQIQELEKKLTEVQEENANLIQTEAAAPVTPVTPVVNGNGAIVGAVGNANELKDEIERLKKELEEKSKSLEENDRQANTSDTHLISEIDSLRAILLAKAGDLKNEIAQKQESRQVLPASDALKELEKQAKLYLLSTNDNSAPVLSHEIAKNLNLSHQTWSNELVQLESQLSKQKDELETLLKEKQGIEQQYLDQQSSLEKKDAEYQEHAEKIKKEIEQETLDRIQEKEQKITELLETIQKKDGERTKLEEQLKKEHDEKVAELQSTIEEIYNSNASSANDKDLLQNKKHEEAIAALQSTMEKLKAEHEEKVTMLQTSFSAEKDDETNQLKHQHEEELAQLKEGYDTKIMILQSTVDELQKTSASHSDNVETIKMEHEEKVTSLISTIEQLKSNNNDQQLKELEEASVKLEKENARLIEENSKLQKEIETKTEEISEFLKEIELLKKENESKESQVNDSKEEENEEEDNEETFVYPQPKEEDIPENINKKNEEEEEEDEEVFVYRGRDAVVEEEVEAKEELNNVTPTVSLVNENASASNESLSETSKNDTVEIREAKLKAYYENQLNNMTEKLQISDSKAVRFAEMYKSLKERLISDEKEKQLMISEIERLNKEVKHVQDLLTTTESNYQKQVDTMTEFISSMQQNQEEQHQRQQQPNRRGAYNQNYR